jgi:hypothetical protein
MAEPARGGDCPRQVRDGRPHARNTLQPFFDQKWVRRDGRGAGLLNLISLAGEEFEQRDDRE